MRYRRHISFLLLVILLVVPLLPIVANAQGNPRQDEFDDIPIVDPPDDFDSFGDMFLDFPDVDVDPGDYDLPLDFNGGGFLDGFTSGLIDPYMEIFRVTPPDPSRYWRMSVYDYYTGQEWARTSSNTYNVTAYSGPPTGGTEYTITTDSTHDVSEKDRLVTLWPQAWNYDLNLGPNGFAYTLNEDAYECSIADMIFTASGTDTISYKVGSTPVDIDQIIIDALGPQYTPSSISVNYTQTPDELPQNVLDYAAQFQGVGANVYETAYAVMEDLNRNYKYDVNMLYNGSQGPDPTEDYVGWFLQRGNGTSAHFASAMAVTLRLLGISSRTVMGFTTGLWSPTERVVYALNVHVWNDVWIPTSTSGDGYWLQFDSSPTIFGNDGDDTVQSIEVMIDVTTSDNVVQRGESFTLTANLTREGNPFNDTEVIFYDYDEDINIDNVTTNALGIATTTFSFNSSHTAGLHRIFAIWGSISNATFVSLRGNSTLNLVVSNKVYRANGFSFSGQLNDSVTDIGLASQVVTVVWQNYSLAEILLGARYPNVTVFTAADGSFSGFFPLSLSNRLGTTNISAIFLGLVDAEGIYGGSISPYKTTDVYGTFNLTYDATPRIVRRNKTIFLYGNLSFDNGTSVKNGDVGIYWLNGTIDKLLDLTTNPSGDFSTIHTVPYNDTAGIIQTYASYNMTFPFLENITSSLISVTISESGIIFIDSSSSLVYTNDSVTIFGWVENQDGDPVAATINILFNGSTVITGVVANAQGNFTTTISLDTTTPGRYNVTGFVAAPPTLVNSSSFSVDLQVKAYTQISSLQVNSTTITLNEVLSFTGSLQDNVDQIFSNQIIALYQGNNFITQTSTDSSGFTINVRIAPSVQEGYLNFSLVFFGSTYLENISRNISVFVFHDAIISINVNPQVASPLDSITISGLATDIENHSLTNRNLTIYWILNFNIVELGSTFTNSEGNFSINYQIPRGIVGNATIYSECNEAQNTNSEQVNIEVIAMQIQPNPLEIFMNLLTPQNLMLISVGAAFIIVVFYLYKSGKLNSLFAPKKKKIDLKEMTTNLQTLVSAGNYKEAIKYSFNVFRVIIQHYYDHPDSAHQTAREFGMDSISKYKLPEEKVMGLTTLYEEAAYSTHTIGKDQYIAAMKYFADIYTLVTGGKIKLV
ncbi:MAG: transglutaminase domain-containing protein [Candidatus Ranarchaeia archaeon]